MLTTTISGMWDRTITVLSAGSEHPSPASLPYGTHRPCRGVRRNRMENRLADRPCIVDQVRFSGDDAHRLRVQFTDARGRGRRA